MSSPNPLDETGATDMAEPLEAWCFIGADDLWALTGDETAPISQTNMLRGAC